MFRVSNPSAAGPDSYNGYYAGISTGNNYAVIGMANGGWTEGARGTVTITNAVQYRVRVRAVGYTFQLFVTNMVTPVVTWTDPASSWSIGAIGLRQYVATASWDNLTVSSV